MKIYVAGNSHLTHYTKIGAAFRGLDVTNDDREADLILIAQDMPTLETGERMPQGVAKYLYDYAKDARPILLMSQVEPGFCRKMKMPNLYHYPETLRIKDSYHRACNPEYIVIGSASGQHFPDKIRQYTDAIGCKVILRTYEEAEFTKIAVNMMLAAQVDYANRMEAVCEKMGVNWERVASVVSLDKRIGPHAYLTPGRWQDSLHLLRDARTVKEIEDAC